MIFNTVPNLKVALVYDKVNTFGGAERVLLALHKLFPQAPLYTSVYDEGKAAWAKAFPRVVPSFLQKFPLARAHPQWYIPLMPLAFETLRLDEFDLVISVTSGEAKGVITKPEAIHLCYCLTPPRYLWVDPGYEGYEHFGWLNPVVRVVKEPLLSELRLWDQAAAARPDAYATTSKTASRRIKKYYGRDSQVIPAPVDTDFFRPGVEKSRQKTGEYFLLVSRLVPYKKVGLAIEAFEILTCHPELVSGSSQIPDRVRNDFRLKIVGSGPDFSRLKSMINHGPTGGTRHGAYLQKGYEPRIELLGQVSEEQLLKLYQNCRALVMPQEEDFGLVALEAMACGKPVIAYGKGGARETVREGKTGLFFEEQTAESLVKAVRKFEGLKFSARACRKQAVKFSLDKFQLQMRKWVASWVKN